MLAGDEKDANSVFNQNNENLDDDNDGSLASNENEIIA